MKRFWHVLGVSMLVVLTFLGLTASVLADCPGNVLVNGGFEGGFSARGDDWLQVADGWTPFWQDGPNQDEGYNRRPEFRPEDARIHGNRRVREGNLAQKMDTLFGTHHGGIWQQVAVPAGSRLTFRAFGQSWSSNEDDPAVSKDSGRYEMSVGIDPTGGTDWTSGNIVWSPRNGTPDQWVELVAQATAQSSTITVFIRGDVEYPVKHNDAYFDDACLTVQTPPTATPRPQPTAAPTATPEPTAEPEPTEAPEPTPTEAPVDAPGVLAISVFADSDGDGLRSEGEAGMAGAEVAVLDADGTELARIALGVDGLTLGDLPVGDLTVVVTPPEAYEVNRFAQRPVTTVAGETVAIDFGLIEVVAPTPEPTAAPTLTPVPTPVPAPASEGQGGLWRISGILVALLAVILPVGVRMLGRR
ncbi:MAG: hypothetical protein GXY68_06780 [Chloroflexi bacterium]|nr:hypothetical protein [Chloroflexota bacterium]